MQLADNALTTLENLKDELMIDQTDSSKDNFLIRKINAFSDWLERTLGRKLGLQEYVEDYTANNRVYLLVNNYPIVSINQITDENGIVDPSVYEANDRDKAKGMVFRPLGWTWQGYLVGLVGEPMVGIRSVTVDYTAGYVLPKDDSTEAPRTLPYDLEDLAINMIAMDYNQQGSKGLDSFSASDVKWKWQVENNEIYKATLDRYRGRFF